MTGRRPLLVGLVLALAAVPACSRGDGDGGAPRAVRGDSTAPDVPLLEGRTGDVVAWLTPLGLGEAPPRWYRERLVALVPASSDRSFARLYLFHVGRDGAAPLVVERPVVEVETGGARHRDVPLVPDEPSPGVRASVLTSKALSTFEGVSLAPGRMLEALVAFEGRFEVADLAAARLLVGGTEVSLAPTSLPLAELRRLLESPGREALVARVPDAAVAEPGEH